MKSGKFAAAEGVKLHLSAVEQYIEELEKDKAALIEALKTVEEEGRCEVCAYQPKVGQCAESNFDCEVCTFECHCRDNIVECKDFKWKGREG